VRLGGELQWTLNLVVYGVSGVLFSLLVCSGWGYGRISGKGGRISCVIPSLRSEMDPGLVFGMISGAGMWLLGSFSSFIWYCSCKGCICCVSLGAFGWF
jgi:hypothetical protein